MVCGRPRRDHVERDHARANIAVGQRSAQGLRVVEPVCQDTDRGIRRGVIGDVSAAICAVAPDFTVTMIRSANRQSNLGLRSGSGDLRGSFCADR